MTGDIRQGIHISLGILLYGVVSVRLSNPGPLTIIPVISQSWSYNPRYTVLDMASGFLIVSLRS